MPVYDQIPDPPFFANHFMSTYKKNKLLESESYIRKYEATAIHPMHHPKKTPKTKKHLKD